MPSPVKLAPSLLAADFARLKDVVEETAAAGADYLHLDVMDGRFVPNLTIGPLIVGAIRPHTDLTLDVHLMIENPERFLEDFARAGADSLTVHVEATEDLAKLVGAIHDLELRAGVAFSPGTPAKQASEVLDIIDLMLVMTVKPGFSGQSFMTAPLEQVKWLRELKLNGQTKALIQVDGGIDSHTAPQAEQAGAEVFVAASAIFNHQQGIAEGIAAIRTSLRRPEA